MERQSLWLLSSFEPIPDHFLHGHCYSAADLVIDDEGYRRFRNERGRVIEPGMDGSYVALVSDPAVYRLGTDCCGLGRIFYYSEGATWAASNSLLSLAEYLRGKGCRLTLDRTQLSAWFVSGTFGRQLVSSRTCIREIQLLPAQMELVISRSTGRAESRARSSGLDLAPLPDSYEEALAEFIETWIGRLGSIISRPEVCVISDLTGGKDTRTVFSLMLAARERFGHEAFSRVYFNSDRGRMQDLEVAAGIARTYGFELNTKDHSRSPRHSLERSYYIWKHVCLGVYSPVYFPRLRWSNDCVRLGGVGGGCHRPVYPLVRLNRYLKRHRSELPSKAVYESWRNDILASMAQLCAADRHEVHPMIRHFRCYRNRCHGGRAAQYSLTSAPLGSILLERCTALCRTRLVKQGQALHDVLLNLDPALAMRPYDEPKKMPSRKSVAAVTECRPEMRRRFALDVGRVFADFESSKPDESAPSRFSGKSAIRLLRSDFEQNRPQAESLDLFPTQYLEEASSQIATAVAQGRFPHAIWPAKVVHVILAGEYSKLASS